MKNYLILLLLVLIVTSCSTSDDSLPPENDFQFEIEEIYSISQNRAFANINSTNEDAIFEIRVHKSVDNDLFMDLWYDVRLEEINSLCNLDPNSVYEATIFANLENQEYEGNTLTFETDSVGTETNTEIVEVTNLTTGRTWMDRNLGADRSALSYDDNRAYGFLYQWGRRNDGHQVRDSDVITEQALTVQPQHPNFISGLPVWNNVENTALWDGLDAINNPCPCGFRLPTPDELAEEINSWSSQNAQGAMQNSLKFPLTGYRGNANGVVGSEGFFGYYWSSESQNMNGRDMGINSTSAQVTSHAQAGGASVRCIKEE